ncbi:hypothetical protein Fcan01_24413 [Folsomia candida]|uniref:Uncharacterized protein n=2 Tax=Folsomia candida TaxID=158441 RepID=A0A226D7U6_FOLCA|nr:hypothetical protein Fcan01_24413 [Folsomia candida]
MPHQRQHQSLARFYFKPTRPSQAVQKFGEDFHIKKPAAAYSAMEVKPAIFLYLIVASMCGLGQGATFTFIQFPVKGTHRTARMSLGTSVNTGQCAHIGRNCIMQRDRADNPSSFTYVPCCEYLTCQGIGPVEIRNGLGQALKSDENTFSGICTVSLDNGGGNLGQYKNYVAGL